MDVGTLLSSFVAFHWAVSICGMILRPCLDSYVPQYTAPIVSEILKDEIAGNRFIPHMGNGMRQFRSLCQDADGTMQCLV